MKLSNVFEAALFATFFAFLGGLVASAAIFWIYFDSLVLASLCLILLGTICTICYSLSNFKAKKEMSKVLQSAFYLIAFLACFLLLMNTINDLSYANNAIANGGIVISLIILMVLLFKIVAESDQLIERYKNFKIARKSCVSFILD
jgi:uncharacterized membrane protein